MASYWKLLLSTYSLAEDEKYTVGVIDAGRYLPDEPLINVPGAFYYYHFVNLS